MACIIFPNILAFPPNTEAKKPPVLGSWENNLLNSKLLVFTNLDSTVGTVTTLHSLIVNRYQRLFPLG
jgi:hypothetical protein